MLDIGVYALSFIRWFMDSKPDQLLSQVKAAPTGVDEQAGLLLMNPEGQMATVMSFVVSFFILFIRLFLFLPVTLLLLFLLLLLPLRFFLFLSVFYFYYSGSPSGFSCAALRAAFSCFFFSRSFLKNSDNIEEHSSSRTPCIIFT